MGRSKHESAEEMVSTPGFDSILAETEVTPGVTVGPEPGASSPDGKTPDEAIETLKKEHQEEKEERTEKKKKKKRKTSAQSDEDIRSSQELQKAVASFSTLGNTLLQILVPRLPNPKPLTDFERQIWNDALSACLEKYIPMLGGWDVEIAMVIVVGVVFAPRLVKKKADPPDITVEPMPQDATA